MLERAEPFHVEDVDATRARTCGAAPRAGRAPYHRNTGGNRVALLAFAAPPEEARRLIEQAGARYVVLCTTSAEIQQFAIRTPDGLAGAIMTGRVPAWLTRTRYGSGPLRVYEVAPKPN